MIAAALMLVTGGMVLVRAGWALTPAVFHRDMASGLIRPRATIGATAAEG